MAKSGSTTEPAKAVEELRLGRGKGESGPWRQRGPYLSAAQESSTGRRCASTRCGPGVKST